MAKRRFQNVAKVAGRDPAIDTLADVIGYITGQTQPPIQPLAATASNAEIIAKINEVIARLQGTDQA